VGSTTDREPAPLAGLAPFEDGDFHCLSEGLARDPQYDDRRLVARRKLAAVGKEALARIAAAGGGPGGTPELVSRTSLHHPHPFNGMRVRRLWAYLCRGPRAKAKLRRVLGPELGKDLDAAYRNAYLCVALEPDALETSLRIHVDAWYDAQNLAKRLKAEGTAGWLERLNALPGYCLRLDDWKGEWRCGALDGTRIEEFLRYWKPGEHALRVERRLPAPPGARGAALDAALPPALADELARLVPLYRFTVWSDESDFLFAR
jgi:hypothetical protein